MPLKSEAPHDGGASRNSYHAEQALIAYVRQFVPNASGEELQHRLALVKARDYAAALRGNTASHIAHNHACDAHEVAGQFVFADVPSKRLEIAVKYCRHTVMAAFLADHLDSERAG